MARPGTRRALLVAALAVVLVAAGASLPGRGAAPLALELTVLLSGLVAVAAYLALGARR